MMKKSNIDHIAFFKHGIIIDKTTKINYGKVPNSGRIRFLIKINVFLILMLIAKAYTSSAFDPALFIVVSIIIEAVADQVLMDRIAEYLLRFIHEEYR